MIRTEPGSVCISILLKEVVRLLASADLLEEFRVLLRRDQSVGVIRSEVFSAVFQVLLDIPTGFDRSLLIPAIGEVTVCLECVAVELAFQGAPPFPDAEKRFLGKVE